LRYAELLKEKMEKFDVDVYLVNTGWVGASAKSGAKRFSLPKTREIINSILGGEIEKSEFETDPYFGFQIPISLGVIDANLLNPVRAWDNLDEYHVTAKELVRKFQANYKQYDLGDTAVLKAGPSL
jgi:phosphoenolpyruvate carboxykinase (ATP)